MSGAYKTLVERNDFHPDTQKFFSGKKVVVTGGSGFIGSHLVEQLLNLGAKPRVISRQKDPLFLRHLKSQVEVVNCDLADASATLESFRGSQVVLNLAAAVAGLEYNMKHPASIFQNNLTTFFNSIKAAHDLKVERFLVTSTACVYPRHCSIPTPEEEGTKDEPEPTNSGYGWAKRMEEYLGAQYAKEYGLSVAIARPYNAYGPRDNFDPESSHVIPALIRKAFETTDGILKVWGDGTHSRSFLYVDDFARGLIETAARYPMADAVNIGAFEEVTIGETAKMVAEYVGELRESKIQIEFQKAGLTGQPRRMCDTTKAEKLLDYRAKMPFKEGLKKTIEWYAATRAAK